MDLLKDADCHTDVKERIVDGISKLAEVLKADVLLNITITTQLNALSKDGPWRLRRSVFETIGNLARMYGPTTYKKSLAEIFVNYLNNTAAAVR